MFEFSMYLHKNAVIKTEVSPICVRILLLFALNFLVYFYLLLLERIRDVLDTGIPKH